MPHVFASLPSDSVATLAASHLLKNCSPDIVAKTLILVPTRRACGLMRRALVEAATHKALLLPRIVALADIETELPMLLNAEALLSLAAIPPAMPEWQRLILLTQQVLAFENNRHGNALVEYALPLAQDLARLQDQCAWHQVALSSRRLAGLATSDDAMHWQQPIEFLGIIGDYWPQIEAALGMTTAACRQTRIQQLITDYWREHPPATPVMVVGSTASVPTTAALMAVIADSANGTVWLPGLDPRLSAAEWEAVTQGHPHFHIKQFLARWPMSLSALPLSNSKKNTEKPPSIWLHALTSTSRVEHWRDLPALKADQVAHIRLVECSHDEDEVRVVTVIVREALSDASKRIAVITPDEAFMDRVAAHLLRYGVVADRLSRGTLANTATGNLWLTLISAIDEPSRMLSLLALFRHPLLMQEQVAQWRSWLDRAERYFRGCMSQRDGQMPAMPESMQFDACYALASGAMQTIHQLSRERRTVSEWIERLRMALQSLQLAEGEGADAIREALEALVAADTLGRLPIKTFLVLVQQALSAPWRGILGDAHPKIVMLTPIEARMQQFDRVIIANLRDALWPGMPPASPWLNFAHQQQLGLPKPEESISLMAHDVLILGSGAEVFLTYARRDAGSPVARSRFIERLVSLLAVHGIDESLLHAAYYRQWAASLDAATHYMPSLPAMPTPSAELRAQKIRVSALDALFSDPYRIYAEYILKLKPLGAFDEMPEARDFGTIAHGAIEKLSHHWTAHSRPASEDELAAITVDALHEFSQRPNIRLFWNHRLFSALQFVNQQEIQRRAVSCRVRNEVAVTQALAFGDHVLTLHGRIDRLEEHADGAVIISDYKTGEASKPKDIVNGKAVQLLAYAMMLQQPVGVDYWGLPNGKRNGAITGLDAQAIAEHQLIEKLRAALADFMNPETPLLAKPNGGGERYSNPYDGISRYDEWAE